MKGFHLESVPVFRAVPFRDIAEGYAHMTPERIDTVARWNWPKMLRFPTEAEMLQIITEAQERGVVLKRFEGVNVYGSMYGVEVT